MQPVVTNKPAVVKDVKAPKVVPLVESRPPAVIMPGEVNAPRVVTSDDTRRHTAVIRPGEVSTPNIVEVRHEDATSKDVEQQYPFEQLPDQPSDTNVAQSEQGQKNEENAPIPDNGEANALVPAQDSLHYQKALAIANDEIQQQKIVAEKSKPTNKPVIDGDTHEIVAIERSMVVRVDGNWQEYIS